MNDNNKPIINWYPGHMNKARKSMESGMKLIDLVIEILDARAPLSSRNPDIDKMAAGKDRLIIMNKADLADKSISDKWREYFAKKGIETVFINSKNKEGLRNVMPAVKKACEKRMERNLKRGIKNQPIRAMVAGIPNVGKSTFINAFCGKNMAKTGNKPGVTKGEQWIKVNPELQLLDTPGILWPKFEDQEVGRRLAYLGSINDEILVTEELAGDLLLYLKDNYHNLLKERYNITEDIFEEKDEETFSTPQSLMMDHIARKRGCLKQGGETDYFKTAGVILDDFRSGKIGKITLEKP